MTAEVPQKSKKKNKNKGWQKVHARVAALAIISVAVLSFFLYSQLSLKAPELPKPSLKVLADQKNIELGMLTDLGRLSDPVYTQILTSQYSFVTSDSQAHWDKLRPSSTTYNFADLDRLVAFAQRHSMPVQVHHLVWGEKDSLPEWLKNGQYTRQQLLELLHIHIAAVVDHYKGKVAEWSVVNERFTRAQHIYGLADWWADHLGSGTAYIDDAFVWAHQADPGAKLILNDFYNETDTSVANAEYVYIQSAKARGVPIDGVGMQMHIDVSRRPDKAAMIKTMQRFAALGTPIYITEFDINADFVKGSAAYKAQLEASITADVVGACVESKVCVSFNSFGMTDDNNFFTWLTHASTRSHLFADGYQPNPSFYAFRQALLQQ